MDEDQRKQIAGFSRCFAVQHFSIEKINECWNEIYGTICLKY